jgi:hypothetical protein
MTRANILIARRNRRREGFPRCNERLSWRRNVIIRPHERPSCVRRPIRTFSSSSLFIFPVIEFFLVVLSAPSRLFYGFLDITLHGPLYTLTCDFLKIEPATAALPKLLSSTVSALDPDNVLYAKSSAFSTVWQPRLIDVSCFDGFLHRHRTPARGDDTTTVTKPIPKINT